MVGFLFMVFVIALGFGGLVNFCLFGIGFGGFALGFRGFAALDGILVLL